MWTHLKLGEIKRKLLEDHAIKVCRNTVRRLLYRAGYKRRSLSKCIATGSYAKRNEQFELIFELIKLVQKMKCPIISIDTKKKERLGNLYRSGKFYSNQPVKVFDHDYPNLAEGKVIPYGIYDMTKNKGFMSIGVSHETAEFIGNAILWWWDGYGIHDYPDATNILIICDSGGANGYRKHVFKKVLQSTSSTIGKEIIVCHYPPYCSKWNPIEHKMFPHVHAAMEGVVFSSYQIVKELIEKTYTQQGLRVIARIDYNEYDIGIKTKAEDVDQNRIVFCKNSPNLCYTIF
jgi:hypothetical protein